MLHQFPFLVQGFHSDNGSEFINHRVEKLLNKLLVAEFTKSRSHRTTDNALVEGKNGAVEVGENGKRRRYRLQDYRTPSEKLLSLDEWREHLKEGISAALLERQAGRMSDTECASRMQQRKRKLLAACRSCW